MRHAPTNARTQGRTIISNKNAPSAAGSCRCCSPSPRSPWWAPHEGVDAQLPGGRRLVSAKARAHVRGRSCGHEMGTGGAFETRRTPLPMSCRGRFSTARSVKRRPWKDTWIRAFAGMTPVPYRAQRVGFPRATVLDLRDHCGNRLRDRRGLFFRYVVRGMRDRDHAAACRLPRDALAAGGITCIAGFAHVGLIGRQPVVGAIGSEHDQGPSCSERRRRFHGRDVRRIGVAFGQRGFQYCVLR